MSADQKAYPSVYGVILNENKVLLMKRQNTCFRNGFYSFPGGRVDNLEHPSLAIIREMEEEVNLSLNEDNIEFMLAQHRISGEYACMDFFFLIKNVNLDEIKINEPDKCSELEWFDIDNLPDNTINHIKESLQSYKNNETYKEDSLSDEIDNKMEKSLI